MSKAFTTKRKTSILFVVDASGSMGVEDVMSKTKGLVFEILKDAYIRREKVGFITFRGVMAELILPFTKSVLLAKKELRNIKTGGKTPLSLALKKAYEEIDKETIKEKDTDLVMLLFSDGRGNISLSGMDPFEEALIWGKKISERNVKIFVIDTDPTWINYPYAKDLAKTINAKYFKLEDVIKGNIRYIIYS